MTLKVYTQEEVDAILPDENGVRYFPTGDYSAIKDFGEKCVFAQLCIFGPATRFAACCSFGISCKFDKRCEFGTFCEFRSQCKFESQSVFGPWCSFENCCEFGNWSKFNHSCNFGQTCNFGSFCEFSTLCVFSTECIFESECEFGKQCAFGEKQLFSKDCTFEDRFKAKTDLPFLALVGAGSEARTCYFYDFQEGIHVRAGCFFGSLEKFKAKVLEDEETPETPSKKTKVYLGFCDLVEVQFN